METSELHAAPEDKTSPMAGMPVELTLVVGSVTMSLSQLMTMSKGHTYTEEVISFFPRVQLHAGSRWVAEGELVQVDGRVGVRIVKLMA